MFARGSVSIIFTLCLFLIPAFAFGATIRVPHDQPTIQAGIDAANDGDTVLVADGTYKGAGNKDIDFKGKAITVRSENGPDASIIDCEREGRGFYFATGEKADSVISGFTVTGGGHVTSGGGIYCSSASPSIINCKIVGNDINGNGGGVYCSSGASPRIIECIISDNRAGPGLGYYVGGGVFCGSSSSPTITNCRIINNGAYRGGGIYISDSSPTISRCIIYKNIAGLTDMPGTGGGIFCASPSSPKIVNCIIAANTAESGKGMDGYGGGIYTGGDSASSITNCTVSGNIQEPGWSSPGTTGGGIVCGPATKIVNTIFWGNSPGEIDGNPDITYSDVKGGFEGLGNINSDPLFAANGFYQLTAGSPCIDAGTPNGAPDTDIDGNVRPQGSGYNMGAYEFFKAPALPTAQTDPATQIATGSATLNGTVNPNGGSSWYYFEYGPSEDYGLISESMNAGSGLSPVFVSMGVKDLEMSTRYHYRLVAANSGGTVYGEDRTFLSGADKPTVTTEPADAVTTDSARLNGTVNPNGASTTYYFQYGRTTDYGSTTPVSDAGSGTATVRVNANIDGLELNKTYHFRLVAENSVGEVFGPDQSFTTDGLAPSVTTGSATSISAGEATLNGSVNPNGEDTTYYFEYGETASYGFTTIVTGAGSGTDPVSVSAVLKELTPYTTYHYRLTAENSLGSSFGDDKTFYTEDMPEVYVSPDGVCGGNEPCYSTIQGAMDFAQSGATVYVVAGDFFESPVLDMKKVIILQGGWDASFETQVSNTVIHGSLLVSAGSLKTRKVILHFQQ